MKETNKVDAALALLRSLGYTIKEPREFLHCNRPGHSHKTSAAVLACNERFRAADERLSRILELRADGLSFKEIGSAFGICGGHARNLWIKAERRKVIASSRTEIPPGTHSA